MGNAPLVCRRRNERGVATILEKVIRGVRASFAELLEVLDIVVVDVAMYGNLSDFFSSFFRGDE